MERERGQGTATHARTEPGKHVTEAVTRAGSCEAAERGLALFHLLTSSSRIPEQESGRRVDGIRWMDYAGNMKNNITDLHRRLHQGSYRAQPGRRHYIPKRWKTTPARHRLLEDKIVQYALVKILNSLQTTLWGSRVRAQPARCTQPGLVRTNVTRY